MKPTFSRRFSSLLMAALVACQTEAPTELPWEVRACDLPRADPHVVQLEGGAFVTLALRSDGTVYCWGSNIEGACGGGEIYFPIETGVVCASSLQSAGETVNLTYGDSVTVWGNTMLRDVPKTYRLDAFPRPTPPIKQAAGGLVVALLAEDGSVWLWGELDGREYRRFQRYEGFGFPVKRLAVNGPVCALDEEGSAYCTGFDPDGATGLTVPGQREIGPPKRVPIAEPIRDFVLGSGAACALTESGRVLCAGDNLGILGQTPQMLSERRSFEEVPGLPPVDRLKVDNMGWNACASNGSEVYCWGQNVWKQIDPERFGGGEVPRLVEPFDDIIDYAPGPALCVLRADRTIWCRGDTSSCDPPGLGEWQEVKFEYCNAFE